MGRNKVNSSPSYRGSNTLRRTVRKLRGFLAAAVLLLTLTSCEDLTVLHLIRFYEQHSTQGPAGGFIFYIDSDLALEAAPYGWYNGGDDPTALWDSSGTILGTGATSTEIGAGRENFDKIIEVIGAEGNDAAQLCANHFVTHDGVTYNDWFLPSEDELNEMYYSLYKEGVGGFKSANYWSSTEINTDTADAHPFGSFPYSQNYLWKRSEALVRPIRRVTSLEW